MRVTDNYQYDQQAAELIPSVVRMISGCHDEQTSADVSNVSTFNLPNPHGKAGGACTSALLEVLYSVGDYRKLSFVDVLMRMRSILHGRGYTQTPQLTSSRRMDVYEPFHIISPYVRGRRRALLIGINYRGQSGQLSGCHNDVYNLRDYLMNVQGFRSEDITILMDDGRHAAPTFANIMRSFKSLVRASSGGDSVFFHYSGHGGRVPNINNNCADEWDDTIIPVDFQSAGQIRDDEIFTNFVSPMPAGVEVMCLMDCCHSGTALDLPYRFLANGEQDEMEINKNFDIRKLAKLVMAFTPIAMRAARAAENKQFDACYLFGCLIELFQAYENVKRSY